MQVGGHKPPPSAKSGGNTPATDEVIDRLLLPEQPIKPAEGLGSGHRRVFFRPSQDHIRRNVEATSTLLLDEPISSLSRVSPQATCSMQASTALVMKRLFAP